MKYQKFIKISIIAFIAAGAILLLSPKRWSFTVYHPTYLGVMFFVSAALIYLPHLVFKADNQIKKDVVGKAQAAIAGGLLANGLGELGLYQLYLVGFEYDKLAHFIIPMLCSIALGELLLVWKNLSFWQMAWRTALIIFASGVGWELWEMLSDILFHTQEWGVYGQHVSKDTVGDLSWSFVGIIFGIIFLSLLNGPKRAADLK